MTNDSCLLADELAGREDGEVWNSANVESSRQLLVLVSVDFEDDGTAGHVGGRAGDLWSRCPAGPAPLSPEIDKNRNLRTLNDLVEQLFVRLQRFINRGQRSLAGAATTCIRKMLRTDTIFLTTLFTATNGRHRHLQSNPSLHTIR